jgi:hypothetical protein
VIDLKEADESVPLPIGKTVRQEILTFRRNFTKFS